MAPRGNVRVSITADDSGLHKGLGRSEKDLGRFASSGEKSLHRLKGAAVVAGGALTAGLVVGLKDSFHAAVDAEKSQAALQQQLKASGVTYKAHAKQIDAVIRKQSELSGFTDNDLRKALTGLVRSTGSVTESLKLMSTTEDVARARHMDLEKAALLVAKAHDGNAGALKRLGITIAPVTTAVDKLRESHKKATYEQTQAAKAADKSATSQKVLAEFQKRFAGQAEAYGKTAAGAQDRFHASLERLQEVVGKKLLPPFTHLVEKAADFVDQMQSGKGAGGRFADTLKSIYDRAKPIVKFFTDHPKFVAVAIGAWAAYRLAAAAALTATRLEAIGVFTGLSKTAAKDGAASGGAFGKAWGAAMRNPVLVALAAIAAAEPWIKKLTGGDLSAGPGEPTTPGGKFTPPGRPYGVMPQTHPQSQHGGAHSRAPKHHKTAPRVVASAASRGGPNEGGPSHPVRKKGYAGFAAWANNPVFGADGHHSLDHRLGTGEWYDALADYAHYIGHDLAWIEKRDSGWRERWSTNQGPTPTATASSVGPMAQAASSNPVLAAKALYAAGFRGQALINQLAIDGRESGWDPTRTNMKYPDHSIGLGQVNQLAWSSLGYTDNELKNPYINARAQAAIKHSQGMGAWKGPGGSWTSGISQHDWRVARRTVARMSGKTTPQRTVSAKGILGLAQVVMDRFPGLSISSYNTGQHAAGSLHYKNEAVDLAGSPAVMNKAAAWIGQTWGGQLLEGIHNPNLSVKNGKRVPSSFWGATTWAQHSNHIHIAIGPGAHTATVGGGTVPGLSGASLGAGAPSAMDLVGATLDHIGLEVGAGLITQGQADHQTVATINRALGKDHPFGRFSSDNYLSLLGTRRSARQSIRQRVNARKKAAAHVKTNAAKLKRTQAQQLAGLPGRLVALALAKIDTAESTGQLGSVDADNQRLGILWNALLNGYGKLRSKDRTTLMALWHDITGGTFGDGNLTPLSAVQDTADTTGTDTAAQVDAGPTPDQQSVIDQAVAATAVEKRTAALGQAELSAFRGAGDIGYGVNNVIVLRVGQTDLAHAVVGSLDRQGGVNTTRLATRT